MRRRASNFRRPPLTPGHVVEVAVVEAFALYAQQSGIRAWAVVSKYLMQQRGGGALHRKAAKCTLQLRCGSQHQ